MKRGLLALCLALAGACSVVNGGDFSNDEGCALELKPRGFSPHVTDTFTVMLTRADAAGANPRVEAVAIFDPLGAPDLDLRMPNAVRPRTSADQGLAAIEFFADFDGTAGFSFPGDHTWVLEDACTSGPEEFPHGIDFTPVRLERGEGSSVGLRLCSVPDRLPRGAVELRVTRLVPTEDPDDAAEEVVDQAIGFYRIDDISRRAEGLVIPGVANLDQDLVVDVVFDNDRDGVFESPGDDAWTFVHKGQEPRPCEDLRLDRLGCPNLTMMGGDPLPACVNDTDLIVILAPQLSTPNRTSTLRHPSWFSVSASP